MVLPNMFFSGKNFFASLRARMDSNRGMAAGNDNGLQFVVMDAAFYRLEIFSRPSNQTFTDSAKTLSLSTRVIINGPFFGKTKMDYCYLKPCKVDWVGEIIDAGNKVTGICDNPPCKPAHRFVGRENAIPIWRYHIGQGDPSKFTPLLEFAIGGLIPIIQNGIRFGIANVGTPPNLTQIHSGATTLHLGYPTSAGRAGVGIHRPSGCIFIFSQENKASPGLNLDTIITRMVDMGVNDAVLCDGSDSTCLIVDGTVHVNPGAVKNRSIPIGLKFSLTPIVFRIGSINIMSSTDPLFQYQKLEHVEGEILATMVGLELRLKSFGVVPNSDPLDTATKMGISLPVSLNSSSTDLHNGVTFVSIAPVIYISNLKLSQIPSSGDQLVGTIKIINSRGEINGNLIINI